MADMKPTVRIVVIGVTALSVLGVLLASRMGLGAESTHESGPEAMEAGPRGELPRLVDLGSTECIPCVKMAPILSELRQEYAGIFHVQFVDIFDDPQTAEAYGVSIIPTQIFLSADGEELARHVGFLGKQDILATWREVGVPLPKGGPAGEENGPSQGGLAALAQAVEGAPLIALGAAVLWGILSIVLSPCHLASIPLVVGYVDDQKQIGTSRAFTLSLVFALGILLTIAIIGVGTAALGRLAGDVGLWGSYVSAAVLILVGLYLLGVWDINLPQTAGRGLKGRGMLGAFAIGVGFGLALGPCTFAYMAPMLAVAFGTGNQAPLYGAALLLAYGIGHCGVIVAAGTSMQLAQRWLDWNSDSRGTILIKRLCGLLVIAAALYVLWSAT